MLRVAAFTVLLAQTVAEQLTLSVDMKGVDVSDDGVWVSGGKWGVSGKPPMAYAEP